MFRILIVILIAVSALLVFQQMEYFFRIIIILTAIIAFLAFRLLGKKVPAPKKPIEGEETNKSKQIQHGKGAKKNRGIGWAIVGLIALVLGLIGTGWIISVMDPTNLNFMGLFFSIPLIVIGILAWAISLKARQIK